MAFLLFIFQNKRRRKRRGTELTSSDKLCDSEVKISCVNKLWLLLLKNEIGVKENDFANNNLLHSHLIRFIFSIFFRLECERECPFRHQKEVYRIVVLFIHFQISSKERQVKVGPLLLFSPSNDEMLLEMRASKTKTWKLRYPIIFRFLCGQKKYDKRLLSFSKHALAQRERIFTKQVLLHCLTMLTDFDSFFLLSHFYSITLDFLTREDSISLLNLSSIILFHWNGNKELFGFESEKRMKNFLPF